ncbi:hypothetical protein MMC07_009840 [Pseudocyphellaria aurata]|nr:hypothetical protein [Pseudocyphellaria aurata]
MATPLATLEIPSHALGNVQPGSKVLPLVQAAAFTVLKCIAAISLQGPTILPSRTSSIDLTISSMMSAEVAGNRE